MNQTRAARLVCPCGVPVPPARHPPGPFDANALWPARVATCTGCRRLLVADDPNVGRVVNSKWKLVSRLGQGGMGSVYLAEDTSIDRQVALKFLHPRLVEREEYRSRFEREAKVMGKVEHPNLAKLFGVERLGATPFLVMKFISGTTLTRVMKQRKVLPLGEVVEVVRQIGAGLSALHAQGYVHRDLKPGNVIVDDAGHVTLLDFGLTRSSESSLTRPGVAMGSPHFMSPEQVTGTALDGRSDLYSLGLLASELLTGKRPYPDAPTQVMLLQHLNESPLPVHVSNPALPPELSRVLLVAMAKKASERQASVHAFVQEFVAASRAQPTRTTVVFPPETVVDDARGWVAEEVSPETASLASAEGVVPKETVVARPAALVTEKMPAWDERTEDLLADQKRPPTVPPARAADSNRTGELVVDQKRPHSPMATTSNHAGELEPSGTDDSNRTDDLAADLPPIDPRAPSTRADGKTEVVDAWNDETERPNAQHRDVVAEARRRHRRDALRAPVIAGVVMLVLVVVTGVWLLLT